jgi:hypothetical protein
MSRYLVSDEVGVRFGLGGGVLFLLSAVVVAAGLPSGYGVGLLLVATLLLSASLDRPHALGLGLVGWAFATGFAVNSLGVLTLAPSDLLRLSGFVVAAALVGRPGGRSGSSTPASGSAEWSQPQFSGRTGQEERWSPGA